ncbi:hypothetical protein CFC21_053319 [Triticum aestivum]|uniref:Uncharacterized protein n=2 Tax=Triticum aestivum TaxID=4565 RepID=A0A3B6HW88_WHEAT|nr:uncharacterized protein LOC119289153 [Triticum dicoccoides]XP_044360611.1 uncharacterized protein LOC123082322 [Triticum aestivum]KAF7044039.1 hypothetical protein CFC21_053319 [Triticum aestivum]
MSRRTRRGDRQQQQPLARSTTVSNNPIFFVHDEVDNVPGEFAKPLPLPPSRAHLQPAGSRRAAGSTFMASRHGSGWVLWRVHHHDPFLAAYVACTKSDGGGKVDATPAKRQQKKNRGRGDAAVQGCGIWSGWTAAGAKYAGAMSCKYGCDVGTAQGDDPAASPAPRLHLSRQLVVIPARRRALQPRGRAQG